jgi:hypothetical protein
VTAPALPVLEVGPLTVAMETSPDLDRNEVLVRATQQVRFRRNSAVQYGDEWTSLVLGAIRGTIHGRTEQRRAFHIVQSDDEWNDELMEALGDVLAAEDTAARRRALLDLATTASEATIAVDYDRIVSKETRP